MYYAIQLHTKPTPKGKPRKLYLVYQLIENFELTLIDIVEEPYSSRGLYDQYPDCQLFGEFETSIKEYRWLSNYKSMV